MHQMKTKIFILLMVMVTGVSLAQKGAMRERIKAQKIAFITDQLQLTSKEAQVFWPVFNAYESKIEEIKQGELRSIKMALRSSSSLTDQEAKDLLDRLVTTENDLHNLKLQLIKDLKSVLPPQKILKLKIADEEFNKRLLEKLREFRQKRNKG
jgi:hypothetical protein